MRRRILLTLLAFGSVTISGCSLFGAKDDENHKDGKVIYDEEKDQKVIDSYYSIIDSSLSGEALLGALKNLNLSKRTSTVGYNNMPGAYKYTDYDPAKVKWDSNGMPYASQISSFYSGKSTLTYDREHVWPASRLIGGRDGNIVDSDIFMPRPTCSEENQARGNSTYVTGMNDERAGWDPVTAFARTEIGVYEGVRGECARIIFYCLTVDDRLEINDSTEYPGNGCGKMGKISDLIEWSVDNPVNLREKRRQVGGQFLQGNRNAFVDHPEYACKIWGNKTDRTRAACSKAGYAIN